MHHSIPVEHARHDLDLIAGHAAGDLADPDRLRAEEVLRTCTACADLRRDLLAIATATRTLPAMPAPRDFQLSEAQAASLRRARWFRSILGPFAAPRSTSRPLAMAFTSLGLAGLLVANILPTLFGSAGATGAGSAERQLAVQPAASAGAAATEAPAPEAASSAPGVHVTSGGPQANGGRTGAAFGPSTQPTAALDQSGGSKANQASEAPGYPADAYAEASQEAYLQRLASTARERLAEDTTDPVFVGSLALLLIGLALFGIRFVARRVR